MKTFKCHKTVEAFQIKTITYEDGGVAHLLGADGEEMVMTPSWMKRHDPQVNGYFVKYSDSYMSYSPQEAFESGYTETTAKAKKDDPLEPGDDEEVGVSPVKGQHAPEAIAKIGHMTSREKLQSIIDLEDRTTVVDAAKARLEALG